jgi:hypothetical protein
MFVAQGAPPVSLKLWETEKIFNHLIFNYFVWEVELTYRYIFAFKFTLSSLILFPLFANCDKPATNFLPVSLTPVANLPPVSTTLAKLVSKFAAGVVDTGGKFAACVVETGGNFATVLLIQFYLDL